MEAELPRAAPDDDAANAMLNSLLLRLERVIEDVRRATEGMPRFVVEARLRAALQAQLPVITFTDADITAWASGFSS
ncbi:hypothetical protein ACTHQ6_17100 [Arthrobacter sp. SAFR-179]|uniref:hypothetical protein n=1 Tax=Arthrobacter sp. SAFR-179 TaxID=3387279 RepID=UPI003F7C0F29